MSEMIEAHARHLRAASQSPHTINARTRLLRQLHDDLPFGLAYASTEELEDWLQSDPTWSQWTRATYAMHIRGFYGWANKRILAGDPTVEMARPRTPQCVPNPVTDDELATALRHSPEPWRTAILLAAFAGLRVSELCGVRLEDVTKHAIRIRQAKGGDPASVDTHEEIWKHIQGMPLGPLCRLQSSGRPMTARWVSRFARPHFDSIDLRAVTMHRFRHWFGTSLLEGGHDIRTVQEALRHKSIVSTQGYTLVRGGQRRLAIRSLPTPTERPSEQPGDAN